MTPKSKKVAFQSFTFFIIIIYYILSIRFFFILHKYQIEDRASIVPLVAGLRKEVLNLVSEGVGLVWESYKLDPYVLRLSECVTQFQEKVSNNVVVYSYFGNLFDEIFNFKLKISRVKFTTFYFIFKIFVLVLQKKKVCIRRS